MRHKSLLQRGFAVVSAIFLLVAMAVLGAAIVHVSSAQQVTGAQDIQGSRALAAARAGVEWQTATILASEVSGTAQYDCPAGPTNFTFAGFGLAVTCGDSDHAEEGASVRVYQITSTASTGGSVGAVARVERQVSATVATCRLTVDGNLC